MDNSVSNQGVYTQYVENPVNEGLLQRAEYYEAVVCSLLSEVFMGVGPDKMDDFLSQAEYNGCVVIRPLWEEIRRRDVARLMKIMGELSHDGVNEVKMRLSGATVVDSPVDGVVEIFNCLSVHEKTLLKLLYDI